MFSSHHLKFERKLSQKWNLIIFLEKSNTRNTENMVEYGRNLTPKENYGIAKYAAIKDGVMSGICVGIASTTAVWYMMKSNATFRKLTNFQSRTGMVIMPALFTFGIASENTLLNYQRQLAEDNAVVAKASTMISTPSSSSLDTDHKPMMTFETEQQLAEMYKEEMKKPYRIVKGDTLGPHHQFLNFWQENPFKILVALGVPSVAYIFSKYNQKEIPFQLKVMQTRVVGQASVITFLLSLIGIKSYLDSAGSYITEAEAVKRLEDSERARRAMKERLSMEMKKEAMRTEMIRAEIRKAKEGSHKQL